ncbi:MAG: kinase-like domain-containing protein [Monoraphidium minutum]|nr:MAG: kinase-like domain-containing protein [Monoraphidium minutum]
MSELPAENVPRIHCISCSGGRCMHSLARADNTGCLSGVVVRYGSSCCLAPTSFIAPTTLRVNGASVFKLCPVNATTVKIAKIRSAAPPYELEVATSAGFRAWAKLVPNTSSSKLATYWSPPPSLPPDTGPLTWDAPDGARGAKGAPGGAAAQATATKPKQRNIPKATARKTLNFGRSVAPGTLPPGVQVAPSSFDAPPAHPSGPPPAGAGASFGVGSAAEPGVASPASQAPGELTMFNFHYQTIPTAGSHALRRQQGPAHAAGAELRLLAGGGGGELRCPHELPPLPAFYGLPDFSAPSPPAALRGGRGKGKGKGMPFARVPPGGGEACGGGGGPAFPALGGGGRSLVFGMAGDTEEELSFGSGEWNRQEAPAVAAAAAYQLNHIPPGDLTKGRLLGTGGFGVVYSAKWDASDVAMKLILRGAKGAEASLAAEAQRMRAVNHPSLVSVYGLSTSDELPVLVMELLRHGDLHTFLWKPAALQAWGRDVQLVFALRAGQKIASGVRALHENNVWHFDLKAANVLLEVSDITDPKVKVTDFGLAKCLGNRMQAHAARGKLHELIPLMQGQTWQGMVTAKADVFSFGVTLWELLHPGVDPYDGAHNADVVQGYLRNELRPAICDATPPRLADLMRACWREDFRARPTMAEVAAELAEARAALEREPGAQRVLAECKGVSWQGDRWSRAPF